MLFRSIRDDGASANRCESSHHDSNGSHNESLAHVFPFQYRDHYLRRTSGTTANAACISAATRDMGRLLHTSWMGKNP